MQNVECPMSKEILKFDYERCRMTQLNAACNTFPNEVTKIIGL
jgi:hypothetical protein